MTRAQALLIVAALWAIIFLPGLGSIEIKGEEGRRILPAVTMMESGNWIVPYIGGQPYLRKPPLIHWLIAASFCITGQRNEWAARMPSALSVLALSLVIVAVCSGWLTPVGALLAAIFSMTNLGMLEKGRLSELEALYISFTGIATVCWLAWWRADRSRWLIWTIPFIVLGLGLLTKGPLHLLFFYAVIIAVLAYSRRLRELRQLPHLLGLTLMLTLFAAWAVPYFHEVSKLNAAGVWGAEFAGRVVNTKMTFALWIENFWNNFENYLPWLLLAPLWWNRQVLTHLSANDAAIFRGIRLAVVLCGCGLILIPGVLSRYTLPLIVPASLLNSVALCTYVSERKHRLLAWLGIAGAGLAALGVLIFLTFKVPRVIAAETARPLGRSINKVIESTDTLYVIDPGYQPSLFYVKPKCVYLLSPRDLPDGDLTVLLRDEAQKKLNLQDRHARELTHFSQRGGKTFVLLRLESPAANPVP